MKPIATSSLTKKNEEPIAAMHRINFGQPEPQMGLLWMTWGNSMDATTYGGAMHAVATHKIIDSGKKRADITKM
jgi:hypothetical protein